MLQLEPLHLPWMLHAMLNPAHASPSRPHARMLPCWIAGAVEVPWWGRHEDGGTMWGRPQEEDRLAHMIITRLSAYMQLLRLVLLFAPHSLAGPAFKSSERSLVKRVVGLGRQSFDQSSPRLNIFRTDFSTRLNCSTSDSASFDVENHYVPLVPKTFLHEAERRVFS